MWVNFHIYHTKPGERIVSYVTHCQKLCWSLHKQQLQNLMTRNTVKLLLRDQSVFRPISAFRRCLVRQAKWQISKFDVSSAKPSPLSSKYIADMLTPDAKNISARSAFRASTHGDFVVRRPRLTTVQGNLVKGRIADVTAANGFVLRCSSSNTWFLSPTWVRYRAYPVMYGSGIHCHRTLLLLRLYHRFGGSLLTYLIVGPMDLTNCYFLSLATITIFTDSVLYNVLWSWSDVSLFIPR